MKKKIFVTIFTLVLIAFLMSIPYKVIMDDKYSNLIKTQETVYISWRLIPDEVIRLLEMPDAELVKNKDNIKDIILIGVRLQSIHGVKSYDYYELISEDIKSLFTRIDSNKETSEFKHDIIRRLKVLVDSSNINIQIASDEIHENDDKYFKYLNYDTENFIVNLEKVLD